MLCNYKHDINRTVKVVGRILLKKISNWNLDKKVNVFMSCLIYAITVIMLTIFTVFYCKSFINQSVNITRNQLSALATNYETRLMNYYGLSVALSIHESVQEYLEKGNPGNENYYRLVDDVKNTLQNAVNMYNGIQFIALVNYKLDDYIYRGNRSQISNNFPKVYKLDYENSVYCYGKSTMRLSYNNAYLGKNNRMLNLYMPVYSTSRIGREIGLLCIMDSKSLFSELSEWSETEIGSDVFIIDINNRIICSTDEELAGNEFLYADRLQGESSSFIEDNNLYSYQKIGKWNFYIVSRIPLVKMYRDNILVVIFLITLSIVITCFGILICKKIVKRAYRPLDDVIKAMNSAAEGNLDVRINIANAGTDFQKVSYGFNFMMDKINDLMLQVKREQQEIDQLRFNALQSQIKPHFLYNTLDCIHWQATADGNNEISVLVKALAQYYRLCLSDGKEIIRLEQEIEHVKNYLIIQNMRYDNIIRSVIDIDESCRDVQIPKITLQPLVENSIYHGIKVKEGRMGELRIKAFKEENDVFIEVTDNGKGMPDDQIEKLNKAISDFETDMGYGVRNVNRRIKILFGHEYGLHYERNESGGITVKIRLPYRKAMR